MNKASSDLHVVCVCCGFGFPNGLATTQRIKMVGKTLLSPKITYSIYHIGGSAFDNKTAKGCFEGMQYRYWPLSTERIKNPFIRKIKNFQGLLAAVFSLVKRSRTECIVIYSWLGVFGNLILKIFGLSFVIEVNEWWPGRIAAVKRSINQLLADGAVVISPLIIERLEKLPGKKSCPKILLPVLADLGETWPDRPVNIVPSLFWCGSPTGDGRKDIAFLLDIIKELVLIRENVVLKLAGSFSESQKLEVLNQVILRKLDNETVQILGFLKDEELKGVLKASSVLLLPMWSAQERSQCRFPTKLALYLASGRPVVTAPVGEIPRYLTADKSVAFYDDRRPSTLIEKLEGLLNNPEWATSIGAGGHTIARQYFDFKKYERIIRSFFYERIK